MGAYTKGLLMGDVRAEERDIQKKSRKKSLWGSIGRSAGGLLAMGLTGGAVNPITLGLLTGGASFLGGAIGAKAAGGKLTGGRFFQSDRESLQKELGAFGSQNIVSSLKSGLTSGFGQAAKLQKAKFLGKGTSEAAKLSEGFGMDFGGSTIGKGVAKGGEYIGKGKEALGKRVGEFKSWQTGRGLERMGEESLGTGIKTRGGSSGLLELPEGVHGPPALSSRPAIGAGRGYRAPGEITKKLEGARRGGSYFDPSTGEELFSADSYTPISESSPYKYQDYEATEKARHTTTGSFREEELYDWSGDIEDIGSRSSAFEVSKKQDLIRDELSRQKPSVLSSILDPSELKGKKSLYDEFGSWAGSRKWTPHDVAMQKSKEFYGNSVGNMYKNKWSNK